MTPSLVAHRWPDGVYCPRCGSVKVYPLKTMPYRWECPDCRQGGAYRFSHIVGTIFENTNVDLRQWFRVIHLMTTSKKGISARQIHRYMGFGPTRRLGTCATASAPRSRTRNFGSSWASSRWTKPTSAERPRTSIGISVSGGTGGTGSGKTAVIGAVSRKGNVVARVIDSFDRETLTGFVREAVSNKVSLLATDDLRATTL